MSESVIKKVYVLTSNDKIFGIWSNLSVFIRDVISDNQTAFYHKIYRHIKAHNQGNKSMQEFKFEFESNNQVFNLKMFPLNEPIDLKDLTASKV